MSGDLSSKTKRNMHIISVLRGARSVHQVRRPEGGREDLLRGRHRGRYRAGHWRPGNSNLFTDFFASRRRSKIVGSYHLI